MDKYISNKIKNISLIMTFFVVILHSNNLENSAVFNINTLNHSHINNPIVIINEDLIDKIISALFILSIIIIIINIPSIVFTP